MHELERHIGQTIERRGLLRRGSPVIVALSGGADSVALLSVLTSLGYECIAAHCNFHLRGAESIRDMRHAETVARQLGVNIYIKEFNVGERQRTTGESVEMACRSLRYEWFHELLDRDYSQAIAVGHHREDNVETFFINLLRSSGLAGLTGMDYRRGFIVRPMLDVGRGDIEAYLADKGLEYVTDSSNAENDFRRNRLRNIIIPMLEQHFPGASDAILATMTHLGDSQRIITDATDRMFARAGTSADQFDISVLLSDDVGCAELMIYERLKGEGFNRTQVDNVIRAVRSGSTGLHFDLADGRRAELDRGVLTLRSDVAGQKQDEVYNIGLMHDVLVPVNLRVTPHHILQFSPERNPDVMYLDATALDGDTVFELRHPRRGDRMRPFGIKGEKLVSDILKDAKYSAEQKRQTWVLTRNGVILWVVGLRASSHFTIGPRTKRYLRLELIR